MKKWIGTIIWLALAVWTLIPVDASKPSMLGYESHCAFVPISTVVCLFLAWFSYWWPQRKKAKTVEEAG